MQYCIYLRKSRSDTEMESRSEEEVLARHEHILLELAKKMQLNITKIYREVVSGESIAARPQIQELLTEVENGLWTGVLVMEVERLARGDTIDQGIMAQTFKFSNTLIITPLKTYDPNNEYDEEYFEFGLFMSRREYKTINRRLQRGRIAAVKEGKFIGSKAPYGYKKVKLKNDKGQTLEPVPEEAEVVRMIFSLYVDGEKQEDGEMRRLGIYLIAKKLNALHIPPMNRGYWTSSSIRDILINPVYIGQIRWNWRPVKKTMADGKISTERPRNLSDDCLIVEGMHPAIIEVVLFETAQDLIANNPPRPVGGKKPVRNPLAGIIVCGKCGRRMTLKPKQAPRKKDYIICHNRNCDNVSAPYHYIEERLMESLKDWIGNYKLQWEINHEDKKEVSVSMLQKSSKKILIEIETLKKQLSNTHDLLEQGIYTTDQFLERSKLLSERIAQAETDQSRIEKELELEGYRNESRKDIIPKAEKLLEIYHTLPSPAAKNDLMKEVLEKVVYTKTVHGAFRGYSADDFELVLYPKIPKRRN